MEDSGASIYTLPSQAADADFVPTFKTALEISEESSKESCGIGPQELFDILKRISVDILSPILEHEAVDKESKELARDLKSIPDYLESYLGKGMIDYSDAIEELSPKIIEAKDKLLQKKKPRAAETKEEHRARILLDELELFEMITVSRAIEMIQKDEGKGVNHAMARRAMKKASEISHNATYLPGWNDGLGSVLRWKEGVAENHVDWYT